MIYNQPYRRGLDPSRQPDLAITTNAIVTQMQAGGSPPLHLRAGQGSHRRRATGNLSLHL